MKNKKCKHKWKRVYEIDAMNLLFNYDKIRNAEEVWSCTKCNLMRSNFKNE